MNETEVITITLSETLLAEVDAHAARLSINREMFITYALIRYMDDRAYYQLAKAVTADDSGLVAQVAATA